jgi:hypothetical protein
MLGVAYSGGIIGFSKVEGYKTVFLKVLTMFL